MIRNLIGHVLTDIVLVNYAKFFETDILLTIWIDENDIFLFFIREFYNFSFKQDSFAQYINNNYTVFDVIII